MSRFDYDDYDGEGMPYELWQQALSTALGGRRGQEALAEMETALLALPEPKLVHGHLVADGQVCAIGALVASKRAQAEGVDIAEMIAVMSAGVRCWCGHSRAEHADDGCSGRKDVWETVEGEIKRVRDRPCDCDGYEISEDEDNAHDTADAGRAFGLRYSVAYHLAYLNDEQFAGASPEERYQQMLAWVRRAQGKDEAVATGV